MTQALATFPGIVQIEQATYTLTHGISPSVATITIAPQWSFSAQSGTLQFFDGTTTINFPNCKLDSSSFRRNSEGMVWTLSILDRRWKWSWGEISGRFNVRETDGTVRSSTEQTPQELAALCLDALDETGYVVTALPNDSRPAVNWDYTPPAEALSRLCDSLGCRVVLGTDDVVRIQQLGTGAALPITDVYETAATIDPPEKPDDQAIVCGPTLFEHDFELEAVGIETDTDETVELIDDLSYKPTAGWSAIDVHGFSAVTASKKARELAQQSVYRWYRIKTPVTIPGHATSITDLTTILPLESNRTETRTVGDVEQRRSALVYGVWFPERDGLANVIDTIDPDDRDDSPVRRSFSLDTSTGIVKFSKPIFQNTATGTPPVKLIIGAATLRLRVACGIRDADTGQFIRHTREQATGGSYSTPVRYIHRPDIQLTYAPTYTGSYTVITNGDNTTAVDAECDYWLDAAEQKYSVTTPESVRYLGFKNISPDGAIQEVGWVCGVNGAFTSASRNGEHSHIVPPYKERRALEQLRAPGSVSATPTGTGGQATPEADNPTHESAPREDFDTTTPRAFIPSAAMSAFDVMEITGHTTSNEKHILATRAVTAAEDDGNFFVINGPSDVASSGRGECFLGNEPVIAKCGSTTAGTVVGPENGDTSLTTAGTGWTVLGAGTGPSGTALVIQQQPGRKATVIKCLASAVSAAGTATVSVDGIEVISPANAVEPTVSSITKLLDYNVADNAVIIAFLVGTTWYGIASPTTNECGV